MNADGQVRKPFLPAVANAAGAHLWWLIGIAALLSFGLGLWGFERYYANLDQPQTTWTNVYATMQLFLTTSTRVQDPIPWQLNVARFLAPIVASMAAVAGLLLLFREQLQRFRISRLRNHIIVCGMGEKGTRLVQRLGSQGHAVVAIERDPLNSPLDTRRGTRSALVVGDARDQTVLVAAGIRRAAHVIALCGSDAVNAEVAALAILQSDERDGQPITCIVQIDDAELCRLLRMQQLASERVSRLEFFNAFEAGARALIADHPPFADSPATDETPHIVFVGLSQLLSSLVVQSSRKWRALGSHKGRRLAVTIMDEEAEAEVEALQRQYPELVTTCDFAASRMPNNADELRAKSQRLLGGQCTIYICPEDEAKGLATALRFRSWLGGDSTSLVVCLSWASGLASLLSTDLMQEHAEAIHVFPTLDRALQPDLVLGGSIEIMAREIHRKYVRTNCLGKRTESDPSCASWEDLPQTLKESNRDQASHIGTKLRAIQCALTPLTNWEAASFSFSDAEIELLAELEHERWLEERGRSGWRFAPEGKDTGKKTSPYIVPWAQLTEEVKEKDRQVVRRMPDLLRDSGFQVVRGEVSSQRRTPQSSTLQNQDGR